MRKLLILMLLSGCAAGAQTPAGAGAGRDMVGIPAPGLTVQAAYTRPGGPPVAPAVVALHGCGGPWALRDGQWRDLLVAAGHPVVFPDSFGSRGLGSQCVNGTRAVTPGGARRADTVATAEWLAAQPGTPPGGLVVMGWSNGGSTVLAAAERGVMPQGLVRGFVAFYPGCRIYDQKASWAPSGPLLIVMGEDDDWTPAAPCRSLAAKFPDLIKLVLYPHSYHEFDVAMPVRVRTGLAYTANRDGTAHVGGNPEARADALKMVPAWIDGLATVK